MSPMGKKRMIILFSIIIVTMIIVSVVGYFLWNMFLSLFGTIEYGIEIRSDEDFFKYDFSGTGSSVDPYIIENYVFNGKYMGVLIQNVTRSFIIRNCTITEFNVGIFLSDIRSDSARVINNEIVNGSWPEVGGYDGIEVTNSSNVLIENNTLSGTGINGISLKFSENCTIKENYIEYCGDGIEVEFSSKIVCSQNNVSQTSDGIKVSNSFNTSIFGNIIYDCDYNIIEILETYSCYITGNYLINIGSSNEYSGNGLYMRRCMDMTITNNTFAGFEDGIKIYYTNSSIFVFNLIENCENYGLSFFQDCILNEIYLNAFIDNSFGNSQGYEYSVTNNNRWYNEIILQGNYWSNYLGSGNYTIDGNTDTEDIYPLLTSPL